MLSSRCIYGKGTIFVVNEYRFCASLRVIACHYASLCASLRVSLRVVDVSVMVDFGEINVCGRGGVGRFVCDTHI